MAGKLANQRHAVRRGVLRPTDLCIFMQVCNVWNVGVCGMV